MEIRNRMADVSKVRCNICQDYLKMIATPNWQQRLYDKAKYEVKKAKNGRGDKYVTVYGKMRDMGIEQYTIDEMDVTLIVEVIYSLKETFPANEKVFSLLRKVKTDRNLKDHSSENERSEELYLKGLLDLCNLKDFVEGIDKYETTIDDSIRAAFRKKYIPMIEQLKELLDDERIEYIHKIKEISKDVERILQSNDPQNAWVETYELYNKKSLLGKDREEINRFFVMASDAGIVQAHSGAIDYFLTVRKDYVEVERRMLILLNSVEKLPIYIAKTILFTLNDCVARKIELNDMSFIIERIKEQGYKVKANKEGFFFIEK